MKKDKPTIDRRMFKKRERGTVTVSPLPQAWFGTKRAKARTIVKNSKKIENTP